jgi:hypothetical protein
MAKNKAYSQALKGRALSMHRNGKGTKTGIKTAGEGSLHGGLQGRTKAERNNAEKARVRNHNAMVKKTGRGKEWQ